MATCVIGRFALRRACSVANVAKKAHTWKHVRTFSISSRILARRCIFNFFYRLSGNCWKMLWDVAMTCKPNSSQVLSPRISCNWRSQYWYTSIVHNTGIKICSSIVYQYCDLKKIFFYLCRDELCIVLTVVSIVIGIVEMLDLLYLAITILVY